MGEECETCQELVERIHCSLCWVRAQRDVERMEAEVARLRQQDKQTAENAQETVNVLLKARFEAERRAESAEKLLVRVPHLEGCHPSEGKHAPLCKEIRAHLEAAKKGVVE